MTDAGHENSEGEPLRSVIGANLRRQREALGMTAEQLSRMLRGWGLKWSVSRITDVEHGQRPVGIVELVVIAGALSQESATTVPPAALLETDDRIQISPGHSVPGRTFQRALQGERGLSAGDTLSTENWTSSMIDELQFGDDLEAVLQPVRTPERAGQIKGARHDWSLADERAARKLELSQGRFIGWSIRLWGKLMSSEVERRAPEGATPQKKGRITRDLLAELQEAMSRGDD